MEPPRMWTAKNRARYDRNRLRYPSDLPERSDYMTKGTGIPEYARTNVDTL
jgi:hypothetical protein